MLDCVCRVVMARTPTMVGRLWQIYWEKPFDFFSDGRYAHWPGDRRG